MKEQGWQYGTGRSEFAYYVPLEPYRTSVPYFSLIFKAYRTRTITTKAYRTSVPYFLAKIKAYCTVLMYRTVLPFLLSTTRNFYRL